MLVLAEVKLVNCSFIEENPVVTVEPVDLSQLGEEYIGLNGMVYLKTIKPIPQCSIQFKLECAKNSKAYSEKDLAHYESRVASLHEDISSGACKPEWAKPYMDEYQSKIFEANSKIFEDQEKIDLLQQFIIVRD